MLTLPHVSEATTAVSSAAGTWLAQDTVTFAGILLMLGGVVSCTRIVCTHVLWLPAVSTAVQVRAIVSVFPQDAVTKSECVIVTSLQLSVAVALPVATGSVFAGHSSVLSPGQLS